MISYIGANARVAYGDWLEVTFRGRAPIDFMKAAKERDHGMA